VLDEASGRVMAMAEAQRVLYTTNDATQFNEPAAKGRSRVLVQ
jgi:two-component sensor histidine kinase